MELLGKVCFLGNCVGLIFLILCLFVPPTALETQLTARAPIHTSGALEAAQKGPDRSGDLSAGHRHVSELSKQHLRGNFLLNSTGEFRSELFNRQELDSSPIKSLSRGLAAMRTALFAWESENAHRDGSGETITLPNDPHLTSKLRSSFVDGCSDSFDTATAEGYFEVLMLDEFFASTTVSRQLSLTKQGSLVYLEIVSGNGKGKRSLVGNQQSLSTNLTIKRFEHVLQKAGQK